VQAQTLGKINATPPATGDDAPKNDQTLPDPTHLAVAWLAALILFAAAVAIVLNAFGWTTKAFDPSKTTTANFALFAGFYVAAQVIERLMQLVTPFLPWWQMPAAITDPSVCAAQVKADRALAALGVAALLGTAASCGFGLYFLTAIGMHVPNTIDSFLSGITIAAGTKPLHDFISLLQNANAPTTGTSSS
jgi:hypothetical protein